MNSKDCSVQRLFLNWKCLVWYLYVAIILGLALGPWTIPSGVDHGDKGLHFLAFLVMVVFFPWRVTLPRLWLAPSLASALAGLIEILQDLSPDYGRTPDIYDFFAGVLGAISGLLIRMAIAHRAGKLDN